MTHLTTALASVDALMIFPATSTGRRATAVWIQTRAKSQLVLVLVLVLVLMSYHEPVRTNMDVAFDVSCGRN